MKKTIAIILAVLSIFYAMSVSAYAEDAAEGTVTVTVGDTDFIFDASTSEEFRSKVIASFLSEEDDGAETYGLMCSLFGHKLESSTTTTITHKAYSTAPKCVKNTYSTQACTRCDYTTKTLVSSTRIACC